MLESPENEGSRPQKRTKTSILFFGKVSSALTCSSEALVRGMELLVRSGNLNLGAFEFVAGAVLGYLA